MITLYHAPRSRASRFIFLLEELGAPFKLVTFAVGICSFHCIEKYGSTILLARGKLSQI